MLGGRVALLARVCPAAAVCRPAAAVESSRRHAAAACCGKDSRGLASATPTQQVPLHAPRGGNPARVRTVASESTALFNSHAGLEQLFLTVG